jgi:tetratricopeptide (TPR) repeat protein
VAFYRRAVELLERGRRLDRVNVEAVRRLNQAHGKSVGYWSAWPAVYLELGRAYLRVSAPGKALEPLTYGRLVTREAVYSEELANAWRALGDRRQAAVALFEGYALDPNSRVFLTELSALYKQIDPAGCAVRSVGERSALDLHCPMVHDDLCAASRNVARLYREVGMTDAAADLKSTATGTSGCPADLFQ